ncbi:MAG: type II secretion system F family protein [Dehalococcoidia bacterium]
MPFLAAFAVFATIFLFVLAISGSDTAVRSRLEMIRGQGPAPRKQDEGLTLMQRMVVPAFQAPVQYVKQVMPTKVLDGLQQRLVVAGEPMPLNSFLTLQLICVAAFLLLPFMLVLSSGSSFGPIQILLVGGFAVVGYLLPQMWLKQRVGQRQTQIIKSLPDSFDLITTCVEAGLGLDAALSRVAEKVEGPFADELSRTLREIGLGKMRREALTELAQRTDVPDLTTFVNAVIQAELMGSSVGAVLRVQADQLRVRRRQRAEEAAYKAPIKMLFPLVLCIFPTLFIVILGPAAITIMRDFPGS